MNTYATSMATAMLFSMANFAQAQAISGDPSQSNCYSVMRLENPARDPAIRALRLRLEGWLHGYYDALVAVEGDRLGPVFVAIGADGFATMVRQRCTETNYAGAIRDLVDGMMREIREALPAE